jgi:spore maturation protein CgeB
MTNNLKDKYRVLVIGESWNGSDCTGLARGFREIGCAVELIGSDQFFPKTDKGFFSKVLNRLLHVFFKNQFNKYISKVDKIFNPYITVIFKGNHISVQTLKDLKEENSWLINFYPDISLTNHSSVEVAGFSYYDHIFTTKSFGIKDYEYNLGLTNVSFLAHGCDPNVHRFIERELFKSWTNDVSFIGTWSKHKEDVLRALKINLPDIELKIWGNGWENIESECLKSSVVGYPVFGDLYAMAINASRINLGLLQEIAEGASSGDLITARTFHIPSSGGFMLHERTEEVLGYFKEDEEIACFSSEMEMVEKVKFYLESETKRKYVAKMGNERCVRENKHSHRARSIIEKYEDIGRLRSMGNDE